MSSHLPATYGKLINQDGNYLLTLQVSVRLSQIKVIYRGLSHKQLSASLESASGRSVPNISAALLLRLWSNSFCLVHLVRQSHSNLGAHQTAPLGRPKFWFSFRQTGLQFIKRNQNQLQERTSNELLMREYKTSVTNKC